MPGDVYGSYVSQSRNICGGHKPVTKPHAILFNAELIYLFANVKSKQLVMQIDAISWCLISIIC